MSSDVIKAAERICPIIKKIPMNWDGKKVILEMKENEGRNWRQMEWIGWYFEYWCNRNLKSVMQMPCSKKYGKVEFDGYLEIPWDFKVHVTKSGNNIIVNDLQSIKNAIKDFGCIGLIVVIGSAIYDNELQDFKQWHDKQKGKISNYVRKNIEKGISSRQRKVSMKISKILFIKLDDDCLDNCSIHNQGKNSNGKPREPKVLLDLTKINSKIVYQLDYS
jgi:hypothetical protein|tara:strand:+ start:522 stop:1178 length:657 start_codon:yes stop_codon:yes gene_type:complete